MGKRFQDLGSSITQNTGKLHGFAFGGSSASGTLTSLVLTGSKAEPTHNALGGFAFGLKSGHNTSSKSIGAPIATSATTLATSLVMTGSKAETTHNHNALGGFAFGLESGHITSSKSIGASIATSATSLATSNFTTTSKFQVPSTVAFALGCTKPPTQLSFTSSGASAAKMTTQGPVTVIHDVTSANGLTSISPASSKTDTTSITDSNITSDVASASTNANFFTTKATGFSSIKRTSTGFPNTSFMPARTTTELILSSASPRNLFSTIASPAFSLATVANDASTNASIFTTTPSTLPMTIGDVESHSTVANGSSSHTQFSTVISAPLRMTTDVFIAQTTLPDGATPRIPTSAVSSSPVPVTITPVSTPTSSSFLSTRLTLGQTTSQLEQLSNASHTTPMPSKLGTLAGQGVRTENQTLSGAESVPLSPISSLKDEQFIVSGHDIIDVFGLECDICNELFDVEVRLPKLLPCKHTVCLCCLLRIGDTQDKGRSVNCPICQYVVRRETIESLPNDHRVVRGLDIMSKGMWKKNERKCRKDDCQNNELFCKTCESVVCLDCIAAYHKDEDQHVVMKLERYLRDNACHFDALERKAENYIEQLKTRIELVRNIKCNLDLVETIELNKIIAHFNAAHDALVTGRNELIEKVKKIALQKREVINTEFQQIGQFRNELQNLYSYYKSSRLYGDSRQTLNVQKKLIEYEKKIMELPFVEELCQSFEVRMKKTDFEKVFEDVESKSDLKLLLSPESLKQLLPN